MERSYRRRSVSRCLIAGLVVAACSFAAAGQAHAYPNASLIIHVAEFDTSTCTLLFGDIDVFTNTNGECQTKGDPDPLGSTIFTKDIGGVGVKMEVFDSKGMVWKAEFHPFGEHLKIFDTRDDGDTIYAQVFLPDGTQKTFSAPGTNATIDKSDFNLDLPEGTDVFIEFTDDAAGTDLIFFDDGTA